MLEIKVPETEMYDEELGEFITAKAQTLKLEHSLVSISKWESKWHKPFLSTDNRSPVELLDYVRCMTINPVDQVTYSCLTRENLNEIEEYINNPMTATTVKEIPGRRNGEIVTSELIYYWMVALEIPFECEKWHLNRLLTLIKVCNAKNQPAKKMSKRDIFNQNRMLNAARRQRLHTRG